MRGLFMNQFVAHKSKPFAVSRPGIDIDGTLSSEQRYRSSLITSVAVHDPQLHLHVRKVFPGIQITFPVGQIYHLFPIR